MFIDASALTAILAGEPDAPDMLARLQGSNERVTSPLALWEAGVALVRLLGLSKNDAQELLLEFCAAARIRIEPVPVAAFSLALEAWHSFGKGNHPAGLNFGDCFAYACARYLGLPLLYKGGDFALTDIQPA